MRPSWIVFYLQLENNNIKWIAETKYNWKSGVFNFINSYRSFGMNPCHHQLWYWHQKMETHVDLRGFGEGDLSNSSSWWDHASSDGRCGGVGSRIEPSFWRKTSLQASWDTSILCLDHDLCQPSGESVQIEANGWFQYVIVITRSREDNGKYNLEWCVAHESYISRKHRVWVL